jgi:glutamyl-tRNA reductase
VTLVAVGIDHQHAPLDLLERATVPEHEWSKALRTLAGYSNVHEAVFLSTCLRTEVIASVDRFHGAVDEVTDLLTEITGLDRGEFADRLTVHFDRDAVTHVFEVAAGLRSVVPGEYEVLGQLRRSFELSLDEHTVGPELTLLFQRALATGRRVRHDTALARGTVSFARTAVDVALAGQSVPLDGATAVVVGAGQLGSGAVHALLELAPTLGTVVLVNRTTARADEVARAAGDRVRVAPLEELTRVVADARLVITAVETPEPLLSAADLQGRTDDLVVVDLAMPRAVHADVADLAGVRLLDIADLRDRVNAALESRRGAIDEAQTLVEADVAHYLNEQRARGAAAVVRSLRDHFESIADAELARRGHDLEGLTDEQRSLVASLVRSAVAKIAHRPTVALKDAAGTDRGSRLTEAVRQLFDL